MLKVVKSKSVNAKYLSCHISIQLGHELQNKHSKNAFSILSDISRDVEKAGYVVLDRGIGMGNMDLVICLENTLESKKQAKEKLMSACKKFGLNLFEIQFYEEPALTDKKLEKIKQANKSEESALAEEFLSFIVSEISSGNDPFADMGVDSRKSVKKSKSKSKVGGKNNKNKVKKNRKVAAKKARTTKSKKIKR